MVQKQNSDKPVKSRYEKYQKKYNDDANWWRSKKKYLEGGVWMIASGRKKYGV